MFQQSILQPDPGPSAKRIKLPSMLDEKFAKANEYINNMVEKFHRAGMKDDELLAHTLSYTIIFSPPEAHVKASAKPIECTELIRNNPEFVELLQSAIKSGRYELVMSSPVLTGKDPNAGGEERSTHYELVNTGVAASVAWKTRYLGQYHVMMLTHINGMDRSKLYGSSTAIIQSSGTGKSRTVHELAGLVFTIPFNLRHPNESAGWAYPPEDTKVWKYLCDVSAVTTTKHGEARAALFFVHLFSEVANNIGAVFAVSGAESKLPPGELAHRWREHLSQEVRSLLYDKIIKACEDDKARLHENPNVIFNESHHALKRLLTALGAVCAFPNERDIKVLLYFDEAHELGYVIPDDKEPDYNRKKRLYDVLCSSLNHFRACPIFTLFLSTQSSLGLLAPSAEVARSSRQRDMLPLQAPFTELPFDCHPSFPLRPGTLNLEQLGDLAFVARFGRPLFWTMIEASAGQDKFELINATMQLARSKLVYSNNIDGEHQTDVAMLATLDVLITIDYEPKRELVHKYEIDMVTSHMRIAFSIPKHRFYIRSGYPSEPFLAEAASRQMYRYLQFPGRTVANLLRENFDNGLIDLGQKGEVVMRLLLRMAYMDAIITEQADEIDRTGEPNFSKGCSFLVFLQALFARQFHEEILRSEPNNGVTSTCTLEDAFEHAVVRFTHFVKAVDESIMNTRSMVSSFMRGAAFICHNRQKAINIIIPILLDKGYALEESSMSALFIQVKRRRKRGSLTAYVIDEKKHGFFPNMTSSGEQVARPYVTLVAELGVADPPAGKSFVITGNTDKRSSKQHPRYGIRTYGCTETTWKVINPTEGNKYQHILGTDDFLADHPRQDEGALELVLQMLPYWCDDAVWYNYEQPEEPEQQDYINLDELSEH
ncbi:hypothetical protein EDC04DRAFT_2700044 [Pisolithus marmoratus]|nr:hypothetical protein EDC04DRAFT_2700044 [Pisolithus marmoratus]